MADSHKTHDHQTIKKWVENRNGKPAKIAGTTNDGGGVLRIHFPQASERNEQFKEIDWNEFFDEFEKNNLDFLYQDRKESGEISTFHKLVSRD